MKSSYRCCLLVSLFSILLFVGASLSNQITWVGVNDTTVGCSFSLPESYSLNVQPNEVRFYTISADSVAFQVHFANSASTASSPNRAALAVVDPYDRFVQVLAQVTQGQIISQSSFVLNGHTGRDAEVLFDNGIDDQQSRMHVRFIWKNNLMYVFSVTSTVSHDVALASARTIFFQSVQLN